MNEEALENYKLSLEAMANYNPSSIQLKVAKAIGDLGFKFEVEDIIKLGEVTRGQASKHRCSLSDSYGYKFKKTKTGKAGRYYRYELVDVTLEQSESYIRRQKNNSEHKKAERRGIKPKKEIDFNQLLNGVFA